MDENFRKKIIIFFIVAVIFAVSVLIYFFFIKKPTGVPVYTDKTKTVLNNEGKTYKKPQQGNNQDGNQNNYTEIQQPEEKKLSKIWDKPTAGFSFVDQTIITTATTSKIIKGTSTVVIVQNKSTSTKIYFVDSMTGFIYSYDLKKKNIYQITNTTIPSVHDAYIFNNGGEVLMRYADGDVIKSLTAQIPTVSEGNSPLSLVDISYLPNDVSSVSTNLFDKNLSYVLTNKNGSTIKTISNKTTNGLYSSLFSGWNISYGGNTVHLTTKPSSYISGTSLNLNSGEILLRDKTGLNILPSKTDENIFGSFFSSLGIKDFIMSTKTGDVSYLTFQTLSEKCEWGMKDRFILCGVPQLIENNNDGLPDAWYKGKMTFNDNLYIKNLKDSKESVFFRFEYETDEKIDMIKLKLNQTENYLGFINKKDKNFWLMKTDYLTTVDSVVD